MVLGLALLLGPGFDVLFGNVLPIAPQILDALLQTGRLVVVPVALVLAVGGDQLLTRVRWPGWAIRLLLLLFLLG